MHPRRGAVVDLIDAPVVTSASRLLLAMTVTVVGAIGAIELAWRWLEGPADR